MRYDCMFLAEVVNNQDPSGFGRVKLLVPGLCDPESVWAFPVGRMFGVKEGVHWVPRVTSNGVLWFNQGHPDHPYFLPGPWGSPSAGPDVHPAALTGGKADPLKVVVAWDQFHALVDGTSGAEKVVLEDEVTTSSFEHDRATGNVTTLVTGPTGNSTSTVKGNLSTTVQLGNETRTISAGSRTTTIATSETETIGTTRTVTVTAADSLTALSRTETIAAASTEVVGGAKSITSVGLSLTSTGTGFLGVTGAMVETFLGAFTRTVAGVLADTVSGAYTLTALSFKALSATIQLGTGNPNGYRNLLNDFFYSVIYASHTHVAPGGGGTTSPPNTPTAPQLAQSMTVDTTAS